MHRKGLMDSALCTVTEAPHLSVIVPARDAAAALRLSCEALDASDYPRPLWELIVVDDGSGDDTALVAARVADTVIRLPGPSFGPAYARNRGVEASRGSVLVFLDPDVAVHPSTLTCLAAAFDDDESVTAVVGSFDQVDGTGLVNGYRDLVCRHLFHKDEPGIEAFWSGCTAVRRDAFGAVGMYDEWRFPRRQIEDYELGQRLRAAGHRVVLRSDVVTTLHRSWTLRELLARTFRDAGMPLARHLGVRATLFARGRRAPLLPLAGLAWCALFLAVALVELVFDPHPWWFALAGLSAVSVFILDASLLASFVRARGFLFGVAASLLHVLTITVGVLGMAVGWALRHLVGDARPAATIEAFSEVGVKTWPPIPARR
jgi:hypothetical protein